MTIEEQERIAMQKERLAEERARRGLNSRGHAKSYLNDKKSGKLTHAAGIVGVTFFSIYLIVHCILTISTWVGGEFFRAAELVMFEVMKLIFGGIAGEIACGVMAYILGLAYTITLIVFSSNLIKDGKKPLHEYMNSIGPMITFAVFFGVWLSAPIAMIMKGNTELIAGILTFVVVALIVTFIILDIVKAKKEYAEEISNEPEIEEQTSNSRPISSDVDKIEAELLRIKALKDKDLITDDEYKSLREKALK